MPDSSGPHALEVALEHLHPPGQQQQRPPWTWGSSGSTSTTSCRMSPTRSTARTLHRVSRQLCSTARATRTYVDLGAAASSTEPQRLPWSFLQEAPGLMAVDIQLQQVPGLVAGPQEVLTSLTGRLKALGVQRVWQDSEENSGSSSSSSGGSSSSSRFEALSLLLAQCTGLQALHVAGDVRPQGSEQLETALLAGTATSSSRSSSAGTRQANLSSKPATSSHDRQCAAATAAPAAAALAGHSGSSSEGGGRSRGSSGMSHAPLLQLQLSGVPLAPFAAWLQRRGQLGQLQRLELKGWLFPNICYGVHSLLGQGPSHFDQSWDWLTSLAGLQEMRLEVSDQIGIPPVLGTAHLQPGLTALRHLTQLSVKGFQLGADLHQSLSALTQLKQLQLVAEDQRVDLSWEWLTALRQLTHLDLSPTPVEQLPEELGEALPHLEVLLVQDCFLEALPKGLTRLSHLDASITDEPDDEYNNDGLEALCDATALRRLNLSGCGITTTRHLRGLQQLEVLQLRGTKRLCECVTAHTYCGHCFKTSAGSDDSSDSEFDPELWGQPPPPLDLPRAVNLRHLDLRSGEWWVEDLVAAGPLQHLTYLDLGDGVAYHQQHSDARHLPDLGVLPSLQQLNLGGITIERRDWSRVGAWLGLQTQLTRLSLRGTRPVDIKPSRAASQGMAHLPTQLVELDVRDSDLQQLPKRLSQLTGLKVLLLGGNRRLPRDLPRWLPALQQLEVLEVGAVSTAKAAGRLLQQLPALRQFSVSHGTNGPASGEKLEPAQQLYEQLPHLQRVGAEVLRCGLFGEHGMEPGV